MTEEDKALVERLRGDWPEILVEKHWMMDSDAIDKQREEAADRIEALAAENERLQLECKAQYDRGYYDGRQYYGAEERAKIVAWLRSDKIVLSMDGSAEDVVASAIEAGDHLK